MPAWAAPWATKVATSKARTRMIRASEPSQAKDSAREFLSWNSASGTTPARAISGSASSRMRPFGTANVSGRDIARPLGRARRKGNMDQMGTDISVAQAFANQVAYCRANDAPITARIVAAVAALLDDPEPG